jgi:hypothetical protein
LVGQPTLADLDLAVDAAVGGVGVDLDHDSILQVEWPLPLEVLDKYRGAERFQHHARWNGRHDPRIVRRPSVKRTTGIGSSSVRDCI